MNGNQVDNDKQVNNQNSIITRRTVTIFGIFVCAFLLITQIEAVKNVFSWLAKTLTPVLMGAIFAYIINPVFVYFERQTNTFLEKSQRLKPRAKDRIARGIGVFVSVFLLLAIIALLLFLIIPEFLESFAKLIDISPSLIQKALDYVRSVVSDNTFGEHLGESLEALAATLTGWVGGELSMRIGGLLEGAISLVSFLVNFLISIVICVYALLEKKKFIAQFKKILYAVLSPARANDVLDVARYGNGVFGKFIGGKLITSTIVGILTFLFMTIMGMQYALLSAGIIAITNVIPFFGPFIGGIPTAFIVLLTNPRHGIIYIIFLVVLQQIEGNIIEPLIMEDRIGVSKFWITVALLLCGGLFGLAGMIFSVPLFAVLFYCIKLGVERSLAKKSLPLSSTEYLNIGSVDAEMGEIYPIPEKEKKKTLREYIAELREKKKK
ncbi:MAG: AI-2E family transporter, partial [Clostridia bacterium]|nr:AI-2E family transporter [Clostridia bacterium]